MKRMQVLNGKYNEGLKAFRLSFISFFLAILCGAIIIILSGYSPIETYKAIITGSLSTQKGLVLSLSQATPLMFTGLAFAIAFKVKIINLGAEGQLYMGALVSAIVGAYISGIPTFAHAFTAVVAGMFAGGLIGLFIGFLKVRFGAHEIIVGIMLNEILILLTKYLATGPLKAEGSQISQTAQILESSKLVRLVPRSQLTSAVIIAIGAAILLELLIRKTALGYEMKITGTNINASKTAGINVSKVYLFTIFVSGSMAGLAGAALSLGIHYRFIEGISTGFGFAGIPVAALAAYNPIAVIFSAFLFGALRAGAMTLNRTTSIPIEFVSVIQSMVVVFVASPQLIKTLVPTGETLRKKFGKKKTTEDTSSLG